MYENVTYEQIIKRMMSRIPIDVDKREGSVIYNALAPAAVEMKNLYIQIDWLIDQMFADTANREYLIRRAAERGIRPDSATYAILKGEFDIDIPIGSRFSRNMLNYQAIERMEEGIYRLKCETLGTAGNKDFGTLIPVEYINGLTRAELTELLIPGKDEEETETFRVRYFQSLDSQAFGGNVADYKEKVKKMPGVGGVKVFRAWNGGGTVRLVILNSEYRAPSVELQKEIKTAIDPEDCSGEGCGLAPIGHRVAVEGVEEVKINIVTNIIYAPGYSWDTVKESAKKAVDEYMTDICKEWENSKTLTVRISRIEMAFLNLQGVLDILETTINGIASNILLEDIQIPVRGIINGS